MKVNEVMSSQPIKSCSSETKLHKAVKIMKATNCGVLPVVDKNKNLLGIITDRDICLSLTKNKVKSLTKISVGKIMLTKTHVVNTSDDISVAFHQMHTNQLSRLPVIDEKGKLKGIISFHMLINKSINNGKNAEKKFPSAGKKLLKTMQSVSDLYLKKMK